MKSTWTSIKQFAFALWPWGYIALAAAGIHISTAVLRLNTFFPTIKLLDFASYYAGAWALRLRISPYPWSEEFVTHITTATGMYARPPIHNSPPIWAWLLTPLTHFSFNTASFIWLMGMLTATAVSTWLILSIAGYQRKSISLAIAAFFIVLTFGPHFLTLTLGQNSFLLLLVALFVGFYINTPGRSTQMSANLFWVVAISAKLYPVFWLPSLILLRRWRKFFLVGGLTGLLTFIAWWQYPQISQDYWLQFLLNRGQLASQTPSLEYSTLLSWFTWLRGPTTLVVQGLQIGQSHTISWHYPWQIPSTVVQIITFVIQLGLALLLTLPWLKKIPEDKTGYFFAWVTFSLLMLPHMARYNLVLLLPGMAWLWGQSENGRKLAILLYFLAALSRLNHLWPLILPDIFIPFAAGFGLYAVLLLLAAQIWHLWPSRPFNAHSTDDPQAAHSGAIQPSPPPRGSSPR